MEFASMEKKVATFRDLPVPTSKTQLQRFLGMVTFNSPFIPKCVEILFPLTEILRKPKRQFKMSDEAKEAFTKIKESISQATMQSFPKVDA